MIDRITATRRFVAGVGLAAAVWIAAPPSTAQTQASDDPMFHSAEVMPMTARSLLLDITSVGDRRVAVGERGNIVVAEGDSGWRQIAGVPTRVTLTAVTAVGERLFAVGHDGVVVRSDDRGETWTLVHANPYVKDSDDTYAGAPFLTTHFLDADNGFVAGAYAQLLRTRDGGKTWSRIDLPESSQADAQAGLATGEPATDEATAAGRESAEPSADDPDQLADGEQSANNLWLMDADELTIEEEPDPHLNKIAQLDANTLLMVAERGALFRSSDRGETWTRSTLPYDGSMFGLVVFNPAHVLAFGLRGHVLESTDGGLAWTILPTGSGLSLFGGAALPNAGAVLVGANGEVLHRNTGAEPLKANRYTNEDDENPNLAAIDALDDGSFLVVGDRGVGAYRLP